MLVECFLLPRVQSVPDTCIPHKGRAVARERQGLCVTDVYSELTTLRVSG